MKKTLKKLLAVTLTLLMLLPFTVIGSFAAGAPEIESVELVSVDDYYTIKQIYEILEGRYAMAKELLGETFEGMTDEEIEDIIAGSLPSYMNFFAFYIDAEFVVTLSDGTVLEGDGYFTYGRYDIYAGAYITRAACIEAYESGSDTIEVNIEAQVSRYIALTGSDKVYSTYHDTAYGEMIWCYVKDFEIVSGVADEYDSYQDFVDLEGATFKITYADGTVKTAEVEQTLVEQSDEYSYWAGYEYTLDGEGLELYFENIDDTDKIVFYFLDAECSKDITDVDNDTFESIEFTDYELDDDGEILWVSYDIIKDGKTISYTQDFTAYDVKFIENYGDFYGPHVIDGYGVYIGYAEIGDQYGLYIGIGYNDTYDFLALGELEETDAQFGGILGFFKAIISKLISIILGIFNR